ncbi:rhsD protein [Burkholderia lata]|uniref:RHS repeat-associated core domain-containing protein n=1 Tax=Burkholderia lata (strain ATCC 17760 / DSM 23089 / LMG 22485 / NCIMB 9086 / R18194 / 383) TaxID=482957 RepID=UPI0014540560|nr:RHS repeat-associated core domain-containing protein [Burkholderia lata]VWB33907.1 rhsD protein [Burkholderia lata]
MALLAVKHLDPVVGVDVHSVLVTPGTPPVFLPHPHVGFMLDMREYIQAAKAVVGCIATMIVQEKVNEYIEHHPEDVKKLEHLADEANQQVNDLMGGGKLPDLKDDPTIAEGMRLAKEANKIKSRISDDLGSNVGSGGGSGRPIFVNGMMRATAGTHAYHVPGLHFPLGESFAPPPEEVEPSNDGESFMGSKTVLANNDPMSYMALEALSCWSVGMEPPPHNSAHTDRTYPSMPSSVMLPIPAGRPVLVGGPPIMNMAAAAKGLFKAFQGSKWAKALADKLNLKSGFLRCNVLHAEPVNAITGEVVVQQRDFTIAGRLPLVWERYYSSNDTWHGTLGVGWQTPADIRMEVVRHAGVDAVLVHFPDHATAFDAMPGATGWSTRVHDWQNGYSLYQRDSTLILRTRTGIEHEFSLPHEQRIPDGFASTSNLTLPVERIIDLNNNAWVFERGPDSRLHRVVEWKSGEPTGRVIECKPDTDNLVERHSNLHTTLTLIGIDGGRYPLVSYENDLRGDLVTVCDAMEQPHYFAYAAGHRMVRHTNARGISFHYNHRLHDDGTWRVDRAWGDNGILDYCFVHDIEHRETRIINSLGHTTILQANQRGNPVARIDPVGGTTTYRYDARGRTSSETDPSGRISTWKYDAYGNLLTRMLPDGRVVSFEYGADHNPTCVTDAWGRQWRYAWDDRGNLIEQTTPGLATTGYEYDRHGQLIAVTAPYGAVTRFDYDRDGNLAGLTDASGRRTWYTHDERANVIQIVDVSEQITRYEYDRNGNLVRTIEAGGRERHCYYDGEGNLTRYRDANGQITQREYSALGHVIKLHTPDGGIVEYQYDTEEQLIGVVNECGEHYQLKRNALGRIVEEVDYWGQSRYYEYGMAGELRRSVDPLGQAIDYKTDALGRIVQKQVPDSRQPNGIRVEKFSYDDFGYLVTAETPDRRVEMVYDVAGRLVEEKQGDNFVIGYEYDAVGNQIERRTQLNAGGKLIEHRVRYGYEAFGSASSITIDDSAEIHIELDALGQTRVEHLGDALRRELSYTSAGLLAKQTLATNTGPLFVSEYTYNANEEMTSKQDSRLGFVRYKYDPTGKLIEHVDPVGKLNRFLYDPAGNLMKTRIRQRSTIDKNSQIDTWVREGELDGCNYVFDRIGNLVRKQDSQQDLRLQWDGDGLLIETLTLRQVPTSSTDGGCILSIRTRYGYDAFHRRVSKVTRVRQDANVPPESSFDSIALSRTSCFLWAGDLLVGELSHATENDANASSNAIAPQPAMSRQTAGNSEQVIGFTDAREWVYYPETFRPLAEVRCRYNIESTDKEAPAVHYFHTDPNGTPTRMIDPLGTVIWEGEYGVWGAIRRTETCDEFDQPLRLQGQYHDTETGLHYNRHRYYSPEGGIFISQDPIGLLGGLNLYRYLPNAINGIDPLGLSPWGKGENENTTAWRGPNKVRTSIEISRPNRGLISAEYTQQPKGKHAEQVAISDHQHDIRGARVNFTQIEGLYVRLKRTDKNAPWERDEEWLPINVCSLVCRPDIFGQLHRLGACEVEAPQVTSYVRKGSFIVPAHFLKDAHHEMNDEKDAVLNKCELKTGRTDHDRSCIPNHQSVVSRKQTKWFKENKLWKPWP